MRRNTANGVVYYTFNSLSDSGRLVHAISTRYGGVSPAPFDSLNLSHTTGDDAGNVETNIRRLHNALALDISATVSASQAQADHVAVVHARDRGTRIVGVDALLTNEPSVTLLLRYADCVPIFLFDPVRRAIGVLHAGWRGTVRQVTSGAARAMFEAFGTRPRDVIACIGPSIGPCCYRVGDDVIACVRAALGKSEDLIPDTDGMRFDLWHANALQLRALGIENIEIAGLCTAHHTDEFYSWRAEKARTGRFGAVISLVN